MILEIEIKGMTLVIINLYAPNVDDPAFFWDLFAKLKDFNACEQVIGGDFNLVINVDKEENTIMSMQQHIYLNYCKLNMWVYGGNVIQMYVSTPGSERVEEEWVEHVLE